MEKLLDIVNVEPHKDNTLLLVFENQEKRLFDMTPYIRQKALYKA